MGGKPATAGHINKVGSKTVANEPKIHGQENLQAKHNDAKSGHFWLFWNVIRFERVMSGPRHRFSSGPCRIYRQTYLQKSAL